MNEVMYKIKFRLASNDDKNIPHTLINLLLMIILNTHFIPILSGLVIFSKNKGQRY